MAFDNFLIEVGLYGSPFQWSYDDFGQLATDSTWFQDLWCLTHAFSADVSFRDEDMVRGVRENDRSLMSEFHRIGYSGKELASLNIVRHYRNLFHLSDISKCDGVTLDEFSVSDFSEKSTHHVFPQEQPTRSDFCLWKDAISRLCSGTSILPCHLGPFLCLPHIACEWFTDASGETLYRVAAGILIPRYECYVGRQGLSTRHGRKYDWVSTGDGENPGLYFASVTMISATTAILHSRAKLPCAPPPPLTFLGRLAAFGNDSLWTDLECDGDGEWIRDSLVLGMLYIAHDGSYMANKSSSLCSAGVIFFCRGMSKRLKVSVSERSDAAGNYRGELLGAVLALLILHAASTGLPAPYPQISLSCDNKGVLSHGNSPRMSLRDAQSQADLIRLMKHLSSSNAFRPVWEWVEGHAVERKG